MSVVLDASVTLAWIYKGETTGAVREVFRRVADGGAIVPSLWHLEVANGLTIGVRRGRIDPQFRASALTDLLALDVQVDAATADAAWNATVLLADTHRLTVYDAAYLELALRRALPLATLDKELREAAVAVNVAVLGYT